jgi:voltage-gated potassium channel
MKRIAQAYPSLSAFEKKLELPMLFVTFAWLFVLIIELVYGTTAALSAFGTSIWVIFILYFGLRLTISGSRRSFLRKNWIVVLAILASVLRLIPFLQSFGGVRAVTATFGMQVVWIFASADQGMRSVRRALGRRGTGYALAFTFVVIFAGAAGMLHFEAGASAPMGIHTYPNAIWWTAMQMTNIGSDYSPVTSGGRVLCLGISVYAAGMFGYLTALFATFLIDRAAKAPPIENAALNQSLQEVRAELVQLRQLIEDAAERPSPRD